MASSHRDNADEAVLGVDDRMASRPYFSNRRETSSRSAAVAARTGASCMSACTGRPGSFSSTSARSVTSPQQRAVGGR